MAFWLRFSLFALACIAGLLLHFWPAIDEFTDIDKCSDMGGCWLARSKACEFDSQARCDAERPSN